MTTEEVCQDCHQPISLEVHEGYLDYFQGKAFHIASECGCGPRGVVSDHYTSREKAEAALERGDYGR